MSDLPAVPPTPEPPPKGQLLIYQDGGYELRVRLDGTTVWLTQAQMAELYQTAPQSITYHLKEIYDDGELPAAATCKEFLQVRLEGGRQVSRHLKHYSLDVILSVGYRVRSERGTRFRQWATRQLKDLLVKGFVLDDERLAAGRSLGADYFDELLGRIRAIRASERRFYQKITDIYATSIDYDGQASVTQEFFATVQNKLHWAIHGQTAAELISTRVDPQKPNLGLRTWKHAPQGPIRRADVAVAKNYLTPEELEQLNRIVSMYLDYAEEQAKRHAAMHMAEWVGKLDAFLAFNEREVLTHAGKVSHVVAEKLALQAFEAYERQRVEVEESDFDREVKRLNPPVEPDEKGKP